MEAKLTFSHTDVNWPTWEAATKPYDKLDSIANSNPSWASRTNVAVGDISYDIGNGVEIFNQLQYSDEHAVRTLEQASNGGAVIDQKNVSNETRVTFGDARSVLNGVGALYLSSTDSDSEVVVPRGPSIFDDHKDSLGAFAELNYRFAERWTLSGGLRYQRDRIQRSGSSALARSDLDYDKTFDAWLPKVSLAYELSDDATVGALVSKGYNPGGVTLGFVSGEYVPFEAETVWNYEIFGRARTLDGRLTLTANLFYDDFRDAQRYVTSEMVDSYIEAVTVNAEKARSYGLEVGFDYRVRKDLRIKGGVGLLETKITEFSRAKVDYEGHEFGRAPGYTLNLGADWDITPQVTLTGRIRRSDGYYSDDANDAAAFVDGYTVADARVTYTPGKSFQLFTYVKNLFDKRSATYLRASRSVGGYEATVVEPRQIGVGVKLAF